MRTGTDWRQCFLERLADWLTGWGNRPMRWPLNAWRNELNGEWLTTQGPTEWASSSPSYLFFWPNLLWTESPLKQLFSELLLLWCLILSWATSSLSQLFSETIFVWNSSFFLIFLFEQNTLGSWHHVMWECPARPVTHTKPSCPLVARFGWGAPEALTTWMSHCAQAIWDSCRAG